MLESRKSTTFRQGKVGKICLDPGTFPLSPSSRFTLEMAMETKSRPFRRLATTTSAPTRPEAA